MADLLKKHLKFRTENHSALFSLYSQWDFDEKLIPKALQMVGSLFTHYSRHDESHSKQILVNIERILGNNISLLTATDTWLLLESAYWHDIGMVVPQSDLHEAINDPQFQEFIESICAQPHHELHSFACAFKLKTDSAWFFHSSALLEMVSKFRELMAEWFRRKHPERAEQIVREPLSAVGINSPRTELIPARLFKLLGRICQMHGAPFEGILSDLPFREAGLAQDDCHPRFVACLLRMGDLLDLDDNRFCPVMQRIAGGERSNVSKAHEDKHAGMRHLRIDQERIEVIAECETIDGYLEAFRWFDWLKQEVKDQVTHWSEIVPNRELGLLPMLGSVSVRLGGNLQILKDGERPAFSIDAAKAIELLQGNNLYDSKFVCIRELLQNAVDATLLRIWLIKNKEYDAHIWSTPGQPEIKELFNNTSISVELVESPHEQDKTDEKSVWTLTIRDTGTGISRNDLEYMLRIGGSLRNINRQNEISRMPEWMKPSGAFGIGLQSAFMLCNEISLITKNIFTNEIFDVTMYSPTGPKDGLVVLRKLSDDVSTPHGTTVKLTFQLDRFASSWSVSHQEDRSIASRLVRSLDPILTERFPYEAAVLADQVAMFGRHSLIPIQGTLVALNNRFEIDIEAVDFEDVGVREAWKFINDERNMARLWYEPAIHAHPANSLRTLYRGQQFKSENIYLPHVRISVDLMSGKAGSWLNFNRDKISPQAQELLEKAVLSLLERAVQDDLDAPNSCPLLIEEKRPVYSLFLKAMALRFGGKWIGWANDFGDAWLDIDISEKGENLRNFFDRPEWTIAAAPSSGEPKLPGCELFVGDSWVDLTLDIVLTEWKKLPGKTIMAVGPKHIYEKISEPIELKR